MGEEDLNAKRSLTTEIKLNFSQSILEVQDMAKELTKLSQAMGSIDGGIDIKSLSKELDNLKALLSGNKGTFTSEGWAEFKKKLNAEVSRGLANANFEFASKEVSDNIYKVTLDKTATSRLHKMLAIAAQKALKSVEFEPGTGERLKVTISSRNLALIQASLNKALSTNLAEKLDFSELTKEGKIEKVKFKITAVTMQKMVDAVREKFFEIMAGSEIIQIDGLNHVDPIKIDSEAIKKALVKVQDALKHVEVEFAQDLKSLQSMAVVNTQLRGFKSGITEAIKQVTEVASILDTIKYGNADNKSKTELQKAVASLHDTVSIRVKNLLKDVVGAIQFPKGVSVTQTDQFAKLNASISSTIHGHIATEVDGVVKMLRDSLGIKQAKSAEGRAAWEKGMQQITSYVDQATNTAMKQVAAQTDFHINTEGVTRSIGQFTEYVSDKITNTVNHALHNVSSGWNPESLNIHVDLVNSLVNPVKEVLNGMFTSIKESMYTFALLTASHVSAESVTVSSKTVDVTVIRNAVNGYLERYTTSLAESVKSLDPATTFGKYNIQTGLVKAASGVSTFMQKYSNHLVTEMNRINKEMTVENTFSVPTRSLPTEVKRILADKAGVRTVSEYQKQNPVQEGEKAFASLTSLQMEAMMKMFHERLMTDVTAYSKLYRDSLNEVQTNTLHKDSLIQFLTGQLDRTLRSIATKIKKELTAQFDLMIEEIKNINATPVSIGYNSRAQTVTRGKARRGSSTGAPVQTSISGGVPESYRGGGNTEAYPLVPFQRDYATQGESAKQHTILQTMATSMRYITAGALIGLPTMLVHEGLAAFKEFDYNMARAQQNFLVKDPSMMGVSASRLAAMNQQGIISNEDYNNPTKYNQLLNKDASDMRGLATGGSTRALQDMAFAYGVSTPDISKAFYTASRRLGDPTQSLALTKEVAKVKGVDSAVDVEKVATGFEAIASQWGIAGDKFSKVADMLIKASHTTQAGIEDLMNAQGRAGAIFRNSLPNMSKDDQLAASIALSAIYVQSTARSGNTGGTFFKSILETQLDSKKVAQLRDLNKLPAFKDVNFTPITNNADGTTTQMGALNTLGGLVDASKKVAPGDLHKIFSILVPMQQAGGQEAIDSFVQDLNASADTIRTVMSHAKDMGANVQGNNISKDSSTADVLKSYVDSIKNANEHDSALIMAGMMDTWNFKQQQIKTMFESATQGVFAGLKGEFSNTATYLNDFLKIVRNNASGIASLIGLISNVGLALGVRYLAGKAITGIDNDRKGQLAKRVDLLRGGLNEEGRGIDLRRQLVDKELETINANRQPLLLAKLTKAQNLTDLKLGKENTILADVQGKHYSVSNRLGKLRANANSDPLEIARLQTELQQLDAQALKQKEVVDLQSTRSANIKARTGVVTAQDAVFAKQLKDKIPEMVMISASAHNLNERMRMTDIAAKDHGIDESKLKNTMQQVSTGFSHGTVDAIEFDKVLKKMAEDVGVDVKTFEKLKLALNDVDSKLKSGTISAKAHHKEVQNLQRQFTTANAGLVGGGMNTIGGNQSASQLLMMIAAGSKFSNPDMFTRNSRPIMQRFRDAIDATKSGGARAGLRGLAFNGALVRGADGKAMLDSAGNTMYEKDVADALSQGKTVEEIKAAKALESEAGLGRFARVGQFAKSSAITAGVMMGISAIGTRVARTTSTPGEIQEMDAQTALNMERQLTTMKDSKSPLGMRIFSGIGGTLSTLSDLLAGGGATKLKRSVDRTGKTEQEVQAELVTKGTEARMKQQEEIFKSDKTKPYLYDERGQVRKTEYSRVITLEDAQQMLTPINTELQSRQVVGGNGVMGSGEYDVTKTKMLISGFREDSKEIRDLTDKFLSDQIILLQTASEQIKTQLDSVVLAGQGDTPAGLALKAEFAAKNSGVSQLQLQQRANKLSTIDNILQPLNRDMKGVQDEFAIKRSDATLSGARDDSQLMKNINAEMYRTINSKIGEQIPLLQTELAKYSPQDEAYKNLWLQIKDLQVEQKDNLVKIRQALTTSLATFNLPQGISAMTYYESVTAKGTHKNMSVISGDTIVNLTVTGDVNGENTVQKIADAVSGAVKPYNTVSRELADNVKRHQ